MGLLANIYRKNKLALAAAATILCNNLSTLAIEDPGTQLTAVGVHSELGMTLDTSIRLTDSDGQTVQIGDLLSEAKPLILVPVYYRCPRLCGLVLGGVADLVKDLDLQLGHDYRIAAYSFNPAETPEMASQKKLHYQQVLQESGKQIEGWDFFVGSEEATKKLSDQLGFGYMRDGEEYAHSAGIFIINNEAKLSQFFTNIDFPAGDVRLALVDASKGKIGNIIDQAMLFCFRFDPTKGKYTWAVNRLLQLVGALSILIVGGIIVRLILKEKKRSI